MTFSPASSKPGALVDRSTLPARLFALAVAAGLVACSAADEPAPDDEDRASAVDIDTSTIEPQVDNTPPPPKPPPPSPGCSVSCRVCPNPSGCNIATANCKTQRVSCHLSFLCCPGT